MNETPRKIEIDGVVLQLSSPVAADQEWIGQAEILRGLSACWLVLEERDPPLSPRLVGPPGIGKTTLAMILAAEMGVSIRVTSGPARMRLYRSSQKVNSESIKIEHLQNDQFSLNLRRNYF